MLMPKAREREKEGERKKAADMIIKTQWLTAASNIWSKDHVCVRV